MRKVRVNIFDDDANIRRLLKTAIARRDYEIKLFEKAVVCPIYFKQAEACGDFNPCADIIITDSQMPQMTGVAMLLQQLEKGCTIDRRNKALMTADPCSIRKKTIEELGCALFIKPFEINELFAWLDDCEKRIDFSKPLWSITRDNRYNYHIDMLYAFQDSATILQGMVTNYSDSGLCFKTQTPLCSDQLIVIKTELPNGYKKASVRWVKPMESGFCVAGVMGQ